MTYTCKKEIHFEPKRYWFLIIALLRYIVGWMLAPSESAILAEKLISETCAKQNIEKGQLTLHADRGSSMKSKPVALLLSDLGITKTHSRPHTSDDNPYSEAQFKTLKYRPDFPERFVKKVPVPPSVPEAAWINKPKLIPVSEEKIH